MLIPQKMLTPKIVYLLICSHTNFHDPRLTHSGRKIIRRKRRARLYAGRARLYAGRAWLYSGRVQLYAARVWLNAGRVQLYAGKTMNSVATTFATQPVCNDARAAQALHSDQFGLDPTSGC
jgi:hypothetical protein